MMSQRVTSALCICISCLLLYTCSGTKDAVKFEPDPDFDISEYVNPDKFIEGKVFDADGKINTVHDTTFTLPSVKGGYKSMLSHLDYPRKARSRDIAGRVVLQVFVDSSGTVTNIGVAETPHPLLTVASANAVAASEFEPATLKGEPVNSLLYLPLYFQTGYPSRGQR